MIKVLVVDNSAVVRQVLSAELARAEDIEVVGTATDPYVARDKIVALRPDVVTLDIEMPRMDGLTFLAKLMKYYPLPVIVVSSVTPEGTDAALRALELGAVEVISKPGPAYTVGDIADQVIRCVRIAVQARILSGRQNIGTPSVGRTWFGGVRTAERVLALGASTGGTSALQSILSALPAETPATIIVQHMPEHFTERFARRLDETCPMVVREVRGGETLRPGVVLVARGNKHLLVARRDGNFVTRLVDGPYVHHQRPSVEVLFSSIAKHVGLDATGVLLTGMGADGARGLLAMREAGARTIVQDEETSVVFGMPRAALELGAAERVLPLGQIPKGIMETFRQRVEVRT